MTIPPSSATEKTGATLLNGEQMAFLRENGYFALPCITPPEDVAVIRQTLEELFEKKAGRDQGAYFNFAGPEEEPDAPNIPQIVAPHHFAGRLQKTQFRRNVETLARQILGPEARFHIDHTLVKPPHDGAPTPWHQDEAFKDPRFLYREISFWMPLQPVDDINGCLHFIPGSHQGPILRHRTPNNDPRIHALECCEGFDPALAVACPLPAGGCTLHFGRTLHSAGPNRSDAPRYAYVLIFNVSPLPAKTPQVFPWLQEKNTARMQRTQQWLRRGGKFVRAWRTIKSKGPRDYRRALLKLGRRVLGKPSPPPVS